MPIRPFKFRRDTSANWSAVNPVLADGEPGFDKTERRLKIGDGVTAWDDLDFICTCPSCEGHGPPGNGRGGGGRGGRGG